MRTASRFTPTRHAANRLRERVFPKLTEKQALRLLERYARHARPLKAAGR
jgi:hypothetical protein